LLNQELVTGSLFHMAESPTLGDLLTERAVLSRKAPVGVRFVHLSFQGKGLAYFRIANHSHTHFTMAFNHGGMDGRNEWHRFVLDYLSKASLHR
jgi:hypothetical protein